MNRVNVEIIRDEIRDEIREIKDYVRDYNERGKHKDCIIWDLLDDFGCIIGREECKYNFRSLEECRESDVGGIK